MNSHEVMTRLEQLGTAQTKKVLMRHGAREPFFGVKVEDLKRVLKEVKSDKSVDRHLLALELYDTGNSDAMYLAGLMCDPKRLDRTVLNRWVDAAYWQMISECTVAWSAAESMYGWELALEWIGSDRETTAAAGWATLSSLLSIAPDETLDLPALKKLIARVSKEISTAPNRVRYTMNGFLIAAASFVPALTAESRAAALNLGVITVDMNGTACKVPYAPDYIDKVEKMGRIGKKKSTAFC